MKGTSNTTSMKPDWMPTTTPFAESGTLPVSATATTRSPSAKTWLRSRPGACAGLRIDLRGMPPIWAFLILSTVLSCVSWSSSFSMRRTASCRRATSSRVSEGGRGSERRGGGTHLVELLGVERDLLEVAHALLLDPGRQLLHALSDRLGREEVGGAHEVCVRER